MAGQLIFSHKEAAFLRALVRRKVDFAVVGLAAAALQGAPVVTQDVDLWFRDLGDPRIRRALADVGGTYVPSVGLNPPMFAGTTVELFDIVTHMHGLAEFESERVNIVHIPLGRFKLPVLRLERIVASKKAAGRPKDRLALKVLADTLAVVRKRGTGTRK